MQGTMIFSSENGNHSMMDLVGSAVLPRDFSNLDLFNIKESKFFFNPESVYKEGDVVIFYVPKVNKPYEAPASYGWYMALCDITAGEFDPVDWRQLSIFNTYDKYITNMEYVNRMHTMHATLEVANNTDTLTIKNVNSSNELLVTDFDTIHKRLNGVIIPYIDSRTKSYSIPYIDIALIDNRNKLLTHRVTGYKVKFGYDLNVDGTYSHTFEETVTASVTLKNKQVTYTTNTGDGRLHLLGIDPIRTNVTALQYAVFGIYALSE